MEDSIPGGRCPMPTGKKGRCGRPLHHAPQHDQFPVCLMHSRDPRKSHALFSQELRTIIDAAAKASTTADFTFFAFPSGKYDELDIPVECEFILSRFLGDVAFLNARFQKDASFSSAVFEGEISFSSSRFSAKAAFVSAEFLKDASFSYSEFCDIASFSAARFACAASFFSATFRSDADFSGCHFNDRAGFSFARFEGTSVFRNTQLKGAVDFRETALRAGDFNEPSAIFALCRFGTPSAAVFYRTDLSRVLFHNCDVSQVTFSSVQWRVRDKSGKRFLFEEEVGLDDGLGVRDLQISLGNRQVRNYELIAETYQQLKKNYDNRRDYWTAGDFHYGEMEMKRLYSRSQNSVVRWLKRNLGLTALYKHMAAYGESYSRPLVILFCAIMVFALLFPIAGLTRSGYPGTSPSASNFQHLSYSGILRGHPDLPLMAHRTLFVVSNSLMTSILIAGFQKPVQYVPTYPGGRLLDLLELICSSSALGLFFIGLRRQFRR